MFAIFLEVGLLVRTNAWKHVGVWASYTPVSLRHAQAGDGQRIWLLSLRCDEGIVHVFDISIQAIEANG